MLVHGEEARFVYLQEADAAANEEDERNIAELLVDQIEFADVILLNKLDLVPHDVQRQALLATIRSLNPDTKVQFTTNCQVIASHFAVHTSR